MTLRVARSSCTFAAGAAAGTVVASTITLAKLKALITAGHQAHPVALTEINRGLSPVELEVSKVYIKSVDDPEMLARLYDDDPMQIDGVMGAFARGVIRSGMLTTKHFDPDHGLQIEYTYGNVAGAVYNSVMAWDLQNGHDINDIAARLIAASNNPLYRPPLSTGVPGAQGMAGAIQNIVDAHE